MLRLLRSFYSVATVEIKASYTERNIEALILSTVTAWWIPAAAVHFKLNQKSLESFK